MKPEKGIDHLKPKGGKTMRRLTSIWVLALLIFWGGIAIILQSCGVSEPQLIPREIIFGNPEKASPQISPDGKLAAVGSAKGDIAVF